MTIFKSLVHSVIDAIPNTSIVILSGSPLSPDNPTIIKEANEILDLIDRVSQHLNTLNTHLDNLT